MFSGGAAISKSSRGAGAHEDKAKTTKDNVNIAAMALTRLAGSNDFAHRDLEKLTAAMAALPKAMSDAEVAEVHKTQHETTVVAAAAAGTGNENADAEDQLLPKSEYKVNLKHRHKDLQYLGLLGCVILAYIFVSGMVFVFLESNQSWTMIDGWYFAVVTIGTVGYGVLTPSHDMTRLFVVFYLMGGMVFFLFTMSIVCSILLDRLETVTKEGDYHKKLTRGVCGPRVVGLIGFFLLIVFSGTFYGIFFEGWNLIESVYFTIVTITTVGYGDYTPTSQGGRFIISFFILLAGGCFSAIVGGVISSYISIRQKGAALIFMMGPLTEDKLLAMPKDDDGQVRREQFKEYMITSLGFMSYQDLGMIDDCFTAMDKDCNGVLDVGDLSSSVQGDALLEHMRARHGIKKGDESKLPLGVFGFRFKLTQEQQKDDEEFKKHIKQAQEYATKVDVVDEYPDDDFDAILDAVKEGFIPHNGEDEAKAKNEKAQADAEAAALRRELDALKAQIAANATDVGP